LRQRVYNGDKPTLKTIRSIRQNSAPATSYVMRSLSLQKNRGIVKVTDTEELSFAEACTLVAALSVFLAFYLRATASPSNYKQRLLTAACMGNM
jgi:hypothetical protein